MLIRISPPLKIRGKLTKFIGFSDDLRKNYWFFGEKSWGRKKWRGKGKIILEKINKQKTRFLKETGFLL